MFPSVLHFQKLKLFALLMKLSSLGAVALSTTKVASSLTESMFFF